MSTNRTGRAATARFFGSAATAGLPSNVVNSGIQPLGQRGATPLRQFVDAFTAAVALDVVPDDETLAIEPSERRVHLPRS